jgi:hypothetical protein
VRLAQGLVLILEKSPRAESAGLDDVAEVEEVLDALGLKHVEVGEVVVEHGWVAVGGHEETGERVVVFSAEHAHEVLAALIADQLHAVVAGEGEVGADLGAGQLDFRGGDGAHEILHGRVAVGGDVLGCIDSAEVGGDGEGVGKNAGGVEGGIGEDLKAGSEDEVAARLAGKNEYEAV